MDRGRSIRRMGLACMLALMVMVSLAQSGLAAGIRVVPSVERVLPGEDFYLDIVAEDVPVDDGLGTVQFRLNVVAAGAKVTGVPDLGQASADSVAIATPLLISEPTATRSGLGPFFQSLYQGSEGVLVLDNEPLANGSALFTYAHTNGANRPAGTGAVARFRVRVGAAVAAEKIDITLTDVLLLDGGPAYPLVSNVGATVTLRCTAIVPDLAGKSLAEAQSVLAAAGLTTGRIYEINNPGSAKPLRVVLEHSTPSGSELDCEAAVDLAINTAPAEVTALVAADVASDDTGKVALSWTPSLSPDTAGYRCFAGTTLLADIPGAEASGTEIAGLDNGQSQTLRVVSYDSFGNQSPGVTVNVTARDDLPPLVTISGVAAGTYYSAAVTPQVEIVETNLAVRTITLNGVTYDLSPVVQDGSYVLAVSATDVSGNTTSRSVAFTVDASAPVITVANLTDGGHYNAARIPEIAIVDANVEATTYLLDGQSYLLGSVVAGEGPHSLEISASDKAGNEASLTLHFVIDKTAPVVTITGVTDGAPYHVNLTPTVSVTDTYLKSRSITLNGQPFTSGTLVSAEGEYVLTVSGEDEAGNSATQIVRFVVDKTAPVIAITGVTNNGHYNVDVNPATNVIDTYLKSSSVTLNGQLFGSGTVVTAEGEYDLSVSGEDVAGNSSVQTVHFVIDKSAPVITISGIVDGNHLNIDVAPTVSITDTYLKSTSVSLNGQPFASGTPVAAEGSYVLSVSGEDEAGNSATQTVHFVIDKTAPVISIAGVTDGGHYNVDVNPTVSVTDTFLRGSSVTLNGQAFVSGTTVSAEGMFVLTVSGEDEAGNSATQTVRFVIDKTAPAVTVTGVTDGGQYKADLTPLAAVVDTYLKSSSVTLNAQPFISGTPVSAEGAYVLRVSGEDEAGNSATQIVRFVVDKTAPVIAITGVTNNGHYNVDVNPATNVTDTYLKSSSVVLNGQPFVSGTSVSAEGAYVLCVSGEDEAGNSATQTVRFVIDKSAPEIFLAGVTDGGQYKADLTPLAAVVDTYLKNSSITLNGQPFTSGTPVSAEGSYVLTVSGEDEAGNSATQTVRFVIDKTAPAVTVTGVTDGGQYKADLTPLAAVVDTYLMSSSITLNGQPFTSGTPVSAEGSYVLCVSGEDEAGNSATQTVRFVIDKSAPEIFLAGVADNKHFNVDLNPTVSVTDTYLKSRSITLNGQPFISGTSISSEGEYVLTVSGEDEAGNSATQTVRFVVDKTAPLITFAGVTNGAHYNIDLTPTTGVSDTYLKSSSVTLNAQPFISGTPVSAEGAYVLRVSGEDEAGNSATQIVRFVVDKTAPVIAITGVTNNGHYNVDVNPATNVTDTYLKSSSVTLNGQPLTSGTTVSVEGVYVLTVSGEDEASNSATQTVRFVIDKTAPVISIAGVIDGSHFNFDVSPTVTVTDTYLKSTSVSLNGQPFTSGTLVSAEGSYVLSVSGEDEAGNSATQIVRFVVDKTAPVIAVTGVVDGVLYNIDVTPSVTINDLYLLSSNLTINNQPFVSDTVVSAEGSYSLAVTAEDRAGNRAVVALDFVIDKTAPTTTSTVGTPRYSHDEQLFIAAETAITLSAVDAGVVPTGVDVIEFTFDQLESWTPYGGSFVLAAMGEGPHDLHYRAADKAGNLESAQTLPVILDKSAPATSIFPSGAQFTAADGSFFVAATTEFSLASTDNLSGVATMEYRIKGGTWTAYAPFTLAGLADGTHLIGYRSSDQVNNVEVEQNLTVLIDNTAPVTTIRTGEPKFSGEALYVTATTEFTMVATDNLSGVAKTEYRIDGRIWTVYASFTLAGLADGEHTIGYRSVDNGSNVETEKLLTVVIDNTALVTTISIGDPKYHGEALYVTGATEFTLAAIDNLSGVAKTEYRTDGGSGMAYAPFTLSGLVDGEHLIEFSSVDKVLNVEAEQAVAVVVDNTPPATSIVLNHQSYFAGEGFMVSRDTEITLNAIDQLSGVAITQYRFDDSVSWSPCAGSFLLTDLAYGVHSLHYRSIDNVANREVEKSVTITLVGVEVETEILNRPRVLVWTEDPAKQGVNNRPTWSIEEVRTLVDEALGTPGIFTTMTADRVEFRSFLRSGIYNMVMILNQDIPFDTIFLREMREAVNRGTGLLVSSWGNSVPPLWQEVFGVDFKGSLSMNEEERTLNLFDSPVSAVQSLTANGRVLRTVLDGGTLAGILPAESTCEGLRGLSLRYPQSMVVGDRVTVSLSVPQGKKAVVVDEEELTISALPQGAVNRFTGNISGDITIGGIAAEGITLSLSSPYDGYLEASYSLSVKIQHSDGSSIATGPVAITPVCAANLSADLNLGPFKVVAVDEDRVKAGDDLPAVVLGEYGEGRTAFLSYNIIESALKGQRSEHLGLLRRSATWLLPEAAVPEAGGVSLIESRVRLLGADLDLQAVDTLGEGLSHQPLFELTHTPLSYSFHLADGEQAVYRYFVRIADHQGDYDKSTAVLLGLDDGFVPFADYSTGFSVGDDSYTLLIKALAWVDGQLPVHPEAADALRTLRDELVRIGTLPRTTPAEMETLIHQTVQTLHQVEQLSFGSVELRTLLDQYLGIVEGEEYFDR